MEDNDKERIWQVVSQIPEGKVASYGQIAKLAELPGYARYVGHVMKKLPAGSTLPWHRVLKSDGQIAFPSHADAWKRQKSLLEDEGVILLNGKVPMRKFRWQP